MTDESDNPGKSRVKPPTDPQARFLGQLAALRSNDPRDVARVEADLVLAVGVLIGAGLPEVAASIARAADAIDGPEGGWPWDP